jgi:hypothetical protein
VKNFTSVEKIDIGIFYLLELVSSISVLLLAFGLVASMANVLTSGAVLTHNLVMQQIWAWTQCIAIDTSVAPSIIRFYQYAKQKDYLKASLYGILSVLLLFTAAIVSNIESVQQTFNLVLQAAYQHVFLSVEELIWIRSLTIVLLIVAHALRHVHLKTEPVTQATTTTTPQLVLTPELIESLRMALPQSTISEAPTQVLLAQASPQEADCTQETTVTQEGEYSEHKQEAINYSLS